jgi:GcrA cell cycle regulator
MTMETWTPERVNQLRNCVVAGLTCSQIAAQIGVTRNAVIGKMNRLGLSPGRASGVPVRSRSPRVQRSGLSTHRRLLRLIDTKAPSIADDVKLAFAPVDSTKRCSLTELSQGKCRWPINEPGAADFAFCGNESIKGFSYCASHARIAYRLPARSRA